MLLPRPVRWLLAAATALVLTFVYVPLVLVLVNSFNASPTFAFPPTGFTTGWWSSAYGNAGVRSALQTSLVAATAATALALLLGTLAAFAVSRYAFFGRQSVSLLLVLPIALPGIVTGIALNTLFTGFLGGLSLLTLIAGHATFCIVIVFNNAVARLRRMAGNVEEASMDLGATRLQTFRHVTFPALRTALLAGGLLAFALSFDEIIVTTFTAGPGVQTLPLWIFTNYQRPNNLPLVNVAAVFVLVLSIVPVYLASRLTSGTESTGRT